MDEAMLDSIVERVLRELRKPPEPEPSGTGCLPDPTEIDIREQYLVEAPMHREEYAALKRNAPCRLGRGILGIDAILGCLACGSCGIPASF